MATLNALHRLPTLDYFTRSNRNAPWVWKSSTQQSSVRRSFTKLDTVKRIRPVDGFYYATTKQTSSKIVNDQVFDWGAGDLAYSLELFSNYSMNNMFPTDYNRVTADGSKVVPDPSTAINLDLVYNSIRAKAREDATNLAQNLVEYRQTADLFYDVVKAVATKGRSLIKRHPSIGRMRSQRDLRGSAANAWLQFQYGVRPLMGDIQSSVDELRQRLVDKPLTLQGVMRRKSKVDNLIAYRTGNTSIVRLFAKSDTSFETRVRVQYRITLNRDAILGNLSSHGFLNPASIAWEIIPYSFVVDWFANIGEVLSSLDNLLLVDKIEVVQSSSVRSVEYLTLVSALAVRGGGTVFRYRRTDTRSARTEISKIASLVWKPSISWQHIANGLALLSQVGAKRRR